MSRFKASTAAAFTAALAVAAHALAGGGWPTGGAVALLAVLAVATGLVAGASADRHLAVILALGQATGHLALAAVGHVHHTATAPWQLMLFSHAVAVTVGAALMILAQQLGRVLSRAIRRCTTAVQVPADAPHILQLRVDHQPLQHVRLLAASLTHRGPPARAY
ncbi:hypothetical protein BVC93_11315 [Mycobacterium sp. MS1601]|uniref:hypothetical protein n=1 Tax=Mycobacterium sp. MS1601 TaxID=1936029 RepID=UPI0009797C32|nr:hypothetical protein [Mycobacterium sp. MS1601]AQA02923.1 hypothetical protein BVC93_11315 [Mycobacterium sp. MS1601]